VGGELQRALAPLGEITALGRGEVNGLCGNLEQPDELRRTIRQVQPQIIANAAAYTDVDRAEEDPSCAERINAEAPGVMAEEAARLDAWFVHYSTDYVFDGSGTVPWREDDSPAPLNVYGATKWRGEQAVRDTGCRHLIFRTQWVYSARSENFIRKILRLAAERDSLTVVNDQFGAPTDAELIADVTANALKFATAGDDVSGTYHLAARGETSWHAYAQFVIDRARENGRAVRVSNASIVPVGTDEFAAPARRPLNGRLNVELLEKTFDCRLPEWQSGVSRALLEGTVE
jgi:dTDP-4-dehydrorhamnose reductase